MDEGVTIERVFNLGDYKSFRVTVPPTGLPDSVRMAVMLEGIFDAYLAFLLHQRIGAELYGKNTDEWNEMIEKLFVLRDNYRENYGGN